MYRDELPPSALVAAASGMEHAALDHGPRSNDSNFGGLEELKASPPHVARVQSYSLPFVVKVATDEEQLLRIQALREDAYGHHLPEMAGIFGAPDPLDRAEDTIVFYAEDKETGALVGSARLQTNRSAPLPVESSVELPEMLQGKQVAEIARLCCLPGYQQPVRMALVKASYLFCVALQINGVVATARRSLVRGYQGLGFNDLYGDERAVPMRHVGGLPHRIMFLDTIGFERVARERGSSHYDYFFRSYHPDIAVFEAVALAAARLQQRAVEMQGWSRAA